MFTWIRKSAIFSLFLIGSVFSAPKYCNTNDNKGAVMYVSKDLECNFIIFNPVKNVSNEKQNQKLYSNNVRRTVRSLSRPGKVKVVKGPWN